MFPSVQAAWEKFSAQFEGRLGYMYLDNKGLVTTGVGNLIDASPAANPWTPALSLPWKTADGTRASPNDIVANWKLVKARQDLKMKGGTVFKDVQNLHLDSADIDALVNRKLAQNDKTLSVRFPGYASWPADAQFAALSMAWAMGANFNYPLFAKAVNALTPNFKVAAEQCYMPDNPQKNPNLPPTSNPGLRPRNEMNKTLFLNAQAALDKNIPHDVLQWADGVLESAEEAAGAVASAATSKGGGFVAGALIVLGLGYAGYKVYQASKARHTPGIAETHQLVPHNQEREYSGPAHESLADTNLLADRLERIQA